MNDITNKTKIILFAALIVAIVLPFASMEMVGAVIPNENVNEKENEDVPKETKRASIKANGYTKKDFKNYEYKKIAKELDPLMMMSMDESKTFTADQREKIDDLRKQLEKSKIDHREKIIDKELRKKLIKAHKKISESDIPYKIIATGIDYVYIQLSIDSTLEESEKYEDEIAEMLVGIPYLLEYGQGIKRGSHTCLTTDATDCVTEVGGLKIQIQTERGFRECSLSVPMKKDGMDGFLTAAHCFSGYSENVYQPNLSDTLLGYSNPAWRSFEDGGDCDCAWILDTSERRQNAGVWAVPNMYTPLADTKVPIIGDEVRLRGFHNNNGIAIRSDPILHDNIEINDMGILTKNAMSFVSPFEDGDSGGSVFNLYNYIGIAVAYGDVDEDGQIQTVFIPWNHIIENISGLEITPHWYFT